MSTGPNARLWFIRPKASFDQNLLLRFWLHKTELSEDLTVSIYIDGRKCAVGFSAGLHSPFKQGKVEGDWQSLELIIDKLDVVRSAPSDKPSKILVLAADWVIPVASVDFNGQSHPIADPAYTRALTQAIPENHWRVERIYHPSDRIYVTGWLVAQAGEPKPTLWIDGDLADVEFELYSDFARKTYWFYPGSPWFGFVASCSVGPKPMPRWVETHRSGMFRTLNGREIPHFKQYRHIGDTSAQVVPPAANLHRISGPTANAPFYLSIGRSEFHVVFDIARLYGVDAAEPTTRVLDWGCGCARITRHFAAMDDRRGGTVGIDIDADNVAWCQSHIPNADFFVAPLYPPTDFADRSFDLIFAVSVLSHLTEDAMDAWLAETNRLLSDTGLALLTFNGGATAALYSSGNPERFRRREETGFDAETISTSLKGFVESDDYYRLTFMSDDHAHAKFARYFDLVDVVPSSLAGFQNTAVLRKKS